MENLTIEQKWNLLEEAGVCEQTLQTVTNINGYNDQSLDDILYAVFGLNDWEEL